MTFTVECSPKEIADFLFLVENQLIDKCTDKLCDVFSKAICTTPFQESQKENPVKVSL